MPDGTDAIHYATVYKVFARESDDGSLEHAFVARVAHHDASAKSHITAGEGYGPIQRDAKYIASC
jgi:hypothetical protein